MSDVTIVDGRHLLWRASDAFAMLATKVDGEDVPTGGAYGFLLGLLRVSARYKGKIVVAWEGENNFRTVLYPQYKKRDQAPDPGRAELVKEMAQQEDILKGLLSACGVRQYYGIACEADDVIGRLATRLADKGRSVIIYSGDSDLRQLVRDGIRVAAPAKGRDKVYDEAAVQEKHGVPPKRLALLKALAGDSSDNIPGVRGIGPVTACTLVNQYRKLSAILEAAANKDDASWPVAERFRAKVNEEADRLPLFLRLTRIHVNARCESIPAERDQRALLTLLKQLRFRSLSAPLELKGLLALG